MASDIYSDFKDSCIKSAIHPDLNDGNLVGPVWPGKAAFPDFWHEKAQDAWKKGLDRLYQKFPFDGLWLDMNENTLMYCSGECPEGRPRDNDDGEEELSDGPRSLPQDDPDYKDDTCGDTWYQCFKNQDKESTYYLPFAPYPPPKRVGHPR